MQQVTGTSFQASRELFWTIPLMRRPRMAFRPETRNALLWVRINGRAYSRPLTQFVRTGRTFHPHSRMRSLSAYVKETLDVPELPDMIENINALRERHDPSRKRKAA